MKRYIVDYEHNCEEFWTNLAMSHPYLWSQFSGSGSDSVELSKAELETLQEIQGWEDEPLLEVDY